MASGYRYDYRPSGIAISGGTGIDPTKCAVTVGTASIVGGLSTTVTLQAKNSSSQNIGVGGAVVTFGYSGGTSTLFVGSVTDNNNGTYTATVEGDANGTAATLSATINGATVTTTMPTVTVTAPWLNEDFSTYSSTANFLSDPRSIYYTAEDSHTENIALDQAVGYGTLTQSYRGTYPAQNLQDYTIRRALQLPGAVTEFWWELWVKFAANFTTAAGNPPDFKGPFGVFDRDGYYRYACHIGFQAQLYYAVEISSALLQGDPGSNFGTNPASEIWNNQWCRFRFHWAVGTTYGGACLWKMRLYNASGTLLESKDVTDKTLPHAAAGYNDTPYPKFNRLHLWANIDPGTTSQTMSYWIGRVRAYNADPGWGI